MKFKKWVKKYARIVGQRGLKDSTVAEKRRCAQALQDALGNRKLKRIQPSHIAGALHEVWSSGQPARARRLLSVARDLFDEAVFHGYVPRNPARQVKALPNPIRRARLSLAQWRAVQKILEKEKQPWRRQFARLALVTGQRRGDLVRLRFSDVWGGYLHVEQQKAGARIALPLALRLTAEGATLEDVINACRDGQTRDDMTILHKRNEKPLSESSLSKTFQLAFKRACTWDKTDRRPPSLHETRSLSERLYSAQRIDTQTLLGHRRASTTALYHDDRGLDKESGTWRALKLPRK